MYVFDGETDLSIKKSLSSVFKIEQNYFENLILNYYITNLNKVDEINYDNFIDYLLYKSPLNDKEELVFREVCIFHKTSSIDNFSTLKNYGLLQLKKVLNLKTEVNVYLKEKGISFEIVDNTPFIIYNNKKIELKRSKEDYSMYSKEKLEDRLCFRLMNDYNINGYLYLEGALKDTSYDYMKNVPEFLIDLGNYIGREIEDDWKQKSKSMIIKAIAKIESIDMRTDYNDIMNENEISLEIIKISLRSLVDKLRNMFNKEKNSAPIKYIYLKMDEIVVPKNIKKYIKY